MRYLQKPDAIINRISPHGRGCPAGMTKARRNCSQNQNQYVLTIVTKTIQSQLKNGLTRRKSDLEFYLENDLEIYLETYFEM